MTSQRLYKQEKLCSITAIDILFAPAHSSSESGSNAILVYPWRAVWRIDENRRGLPARFVISVPKKRLRHAIDRVKMRRRMREAYRLNRNEFTATSGMDIALIYISDRLTNYEACRRSITKIIDRISTPRD